MIFVDTGAWIALTDKSDHYHEKARTIYNQLKQQSVRFLTSDYVIDETVTRLRYDAGHHPAVTFLNLIEASQTTGALKMAFVDASVYEQSAALFKQYDSVTLSFTDCTSFIVCHQNEIREAFAFDHHFTMMGVGLCQVKGS